MELFFNHIFSWSIFLIIIVYTIYTSIVIKEEKKSFLENSKTIKLLNFIFEVPSWWKIEQIENQFNFERMEENYDWQGSLTIENPPATTLLNRYALYLKSQKILLDEKDSIIQNQTQLNSKFINITPEEVLHIESMGTQNNEKRIYLSSYLFLINNKLIMANSLSSVLNGMLEGPYFEEVLYRIKLKKFPSDDLIKSEVV